MSAESIIVMGVKSENPFILCTGSGIVALKKSTSCVKIITKSTFEGSGAGQTFENSFFLFWAIHFVWLGDRPYAEK